MSPEVVVALLGPLPFAFGNFKVGSWGITSQEAFAVRLPGSWCGERVSKAIVEAQGFGIDVPEIYIDRGRSLGSGKGQTLFPLFKGINPFH